MSGTHAPAVEALPDGWRPVPEYPDWRWNPETRQFRRAPFPNCGEYDWRHEFFVSFPCTDAMAEELVRAWRTGAVHGRETAQWEMRKALGLGR